VLAQINSSSRKSFPKRTLQSASYNDRMVSTVITFTKADVQPPVYIAGGFTDWSPMEMQCESTQSGQNKFTHTTELQPGEHQYKFRLGPGDWWVLDESAPTGQYIPH
jgi:1,4-alpha-glucan branching enzyme